jgi:hypothetical protein
MPVKRLDILRHLPYWGHASQRALYSETKKIGVLTLPG